MRIIKIKTYHLYSHFHGLLISTIVIGPNLMNKETSFGGYDNSMRKKHSVMHVLKEWFFFI